MLWALHSVWRAFGECSI
uniref:Uncharacterized protein n=1 Tax=Anguilla anguilla TaxID=7936 RepID=A0A0E9PUU9_ANGAN